MEGYLNNSRGLVLGDLKVQLGTPRVKAASGGRPGGGGMQRRVVKVFLETEGGGSRVEKG